MLIRLSLWGTCRWLLTDHLDFSVGPTAALFRLESLGRNDEGSVSLAENETCLLPSLRWSMLNLYIYIHIIGYQSTNKIYDSWYVEQQLS